MASDATAPVAAAAPAVDWQDEVEALWRSEEWGTLLGDLAGSAGGPSVAALLRQAAAVSHSGSSGGGSRVRLAEVVQQVAWEKLHTGDWNAVAVVWRDAYAAACILAAAAGLPGRSGEAAGAAEAPGAAAAAAAVSPEEAGIGSALWHLDMAAIMGGPLLRPLCDAVIGKLQRRWQHLRGAATWQPRARNQPGAQQQAGGEAGGGEPAAKRARRLGEGAEGGAAVAAAAAAAEAALLPPGSLGPHGTPVAEAELPSLEAFWKDYMSQDTPVVISGAMEDWPALERWVDPEYLVAVAGPRTVPVEVGEHYLAEEWGQQLMTLQEFVQRHILGGSAHAGGGAPGAAAAAAEGQPQGAATAAAPSAARRGYLAQHPLFDQIPALAADIREPPYCVLGEGEVQSINAWFGPAGTVTPLHTDPHANLLCQAAGRKYVRLYAPAATPAMYPHAEGMHTNTGQVDVDAPDQQQHPLFAAAPFQDCVLEAGQMLFIPPGWWHYVRSTTPSFSVSYWWR